MVRRANRRTDNEPFDPTKLSTRTPQTKLRGAAPVQGALDDRIEDRPLTLEESKRIGEQNRYAAEHTAQATALLLDGVLERLDRAPKSPDRVRAFERYLAHAAIQLEGLFIYSGPDLVDGERSNASLMRQELGPEIGALKDKLAEIRSKVTELSSPLSDRARHTLDQILGPPIRPKDDDQIFRHEIRDAMRSYTASGGPAAGSSNFVGTESDYLDPSGQHGDHVVYFGSGPDVLRALTDFPRAKNHHFVDSWLGWGRSPKEVIDEVKNRLGALGADAEVRLQSAGFLGTISQAELSNPGAFDDAVFGPTADAQMKAPAVFEVSWTSPSQGPQTRSFSLHAVDYNREEDVDRVLDSIPKGELAGAILAGAPLPQREVTDRVFDRFNDDSTWVVSSPEPSERKSHFSNRRIDAIGPWTIPDYPHQPAGEVTPKLEAHSFEEKYAYEASLIWLVKR